MLQIRGETVMAANGILVRNVGRGRLLALVLALVCAANVAEAGTVQLSAHAHDSGAELHVPKTVSHPTFAIADTGNVNRPGAHARSWGAAVVSGGVLRKATGGEGWVINGNSPKHQYWYANAGTGEFIINDLDASFAQLTLLIRRTGEAQNPATPAQAPPEIGQYPSQGFFAESAFSVQVKLDASVIQDGVRSDLFTGRAVLNGPQNPNPGISQFGDFDALGVFTATQLVGNPGQERLGVIVENDVFSEETATVVTGQQFTLNLDLILSQYEINSLPFEPPLVDTGDILASSSGDFVVEILATDGFGRTLEITPVPEPSTVGLGVVAMVGAGTMLWRRGRAVRRVS
jgi:hypothetical protein